MRVKNLKDSIGVLVVPCNNPNCPDHTKINLIENILMSKNEEKKKEEEKVAPPKE